MGGWIDWNPALEVALVGALVALLPLLWVLVKGRREGLQGWPAWQRALTLATLFLTLDLVVFGAFTRLTDSGLGCPDWPGCYGHHSPVGARSLIDQAQALLPSGPITHGKAWIEMIHRYLASGVGALIAGLMVAAWWGRRRIGSLSPWWPTLTFVWVCAQGAFGAFTVTLKLYPLVVTGHLLGGLLGVGLLTAQARVMDAANPTRTGAWRRSSLRAWALAVLVLAVVQMALGGWVSTNSAVLACSEVPLCQGQWWPAMDFETGFRLLRPLGGDGLGAQITLAGLTAIHMVHRLAAVVVLLAMVALAWGLWRARHWRREAVGLWALATWQLLTGLSNVVLGWPLVAALGHTLGAALLVWWLVRLLVQPRAAPFSPRSS
ncbi:COX15/CtaA family protein [Aquabacterium sp.]|uniref:COX15/CtaA family protein n=1 Tax=Aquabacterium sp. TaxID=1872578 RepID=UPI003D6C928A